MSHSRKKDAIDGKAEWFNRRPSVYASYNFDSAKIRFTQMVEALENDAKSGNIHNDRYKQAIQNISTSSKEIIKVFDKEFKEKNIGGFEKEVRSLIDFLNTTTDFLSLISAKPVDLQPIAQQQAMPVKSINIQEIAKLHQIADTISARLRPTSLDKAVAAIGMLFGALLTIVTLGRHTGLFNNAYALFSGKNAKTIDTFYCRVTGDDLTHIKNHYQYAHKKP